LPSAPPSAVMAPMPCGSGKRIFSAIFLFSSYGVEEIGVEATAVVDETVIVPTSSFSVEEIGVEATAVVDETVVVPTSSFGVEEIGVEATAVVETVVVPTSGMVKSSGF
jgi:hypothetical protein